MNVLREVCHCGNHKDSHHEGVWNCLAVGCNDCKFYRDDTKPDFERARRIRPFHEGKWRGGTWVECGCYACNQWRAGK